MTHTHTVALIALSPEAYDEIADKLSAAGYDVRAMDANGGSDPFAIDMTGIGLVRTEPTIEISHANSRQVGGSHYGGYALQHWDLVIAFNWDYFQGQITKYVMRWKNKNGIEDLRKAAHFLEKYIESETKKLKQAPLPGIKIEYTGLPGEIVAGSGGAGGVAK